MHKGKGRPSFKVRNAEKINSDLGKHALINGFFPFAVYNHGDSTATKNLDYQGCPMLTDSYEYYLSNQDTFKA